MHSASCYSRALVCAVENLRDQTYYSDTTKLELSGDEADAAFHAVVASGEITRQADRYLRDGMLACRPGCPEGLVI